MWLLVGCGTAWDIAELLEDPEAPLPPQRLQGEGPDCGFGMRVLRAGQAVLVAAPLCGEVATRRGPDGAGPRFYGAGLAATGDLLLVGSPEEGRVHDLASGGVLAEGEQLGGVIAARDGRWVASTHAGARWDHGEILLWGRRPDALALWSDGTLAAGFATGEVALRIGETVVAREAEGDLEGTALAVGDILGDGRELLASGAPGVGRVRVYDRAGTPVTEWSGEGRFGAAIAHFAPGQLYVGAPMAGEAAGALWRVEGGVATQVGEGPSRGDEYGFALWAGLGNVLVGAPGGPGGVGFVDVLNP